VGDGVLQVARSGDSDKISVLVDRGEAARDIDRDTATQELAAVDAELGKSKAETAADVTALLGKRAWAAARVDAANRVK
jgi:F0F1-type ATP synthase epsilon subunit